MRKLNLSRSFVFPLLSLAVVASPSFADDLFVASSNTVVGRVDAAGGVVQPVSACFGLPVASTIDGAFLFLGDPFGNVYRMDVASGVQAAFGSVSTSIRGLATRGRELLVGMSSGVVVRLDKSTGTNLGTVSVPHDLTSMTLVGSRLFIGSTSGLITGLDLDGGPATTLGSCTGAISSMTADATHLLVGTNTGWVFRMNTANGFLDAFFTVDSDCTTLAIHGGSLLVGGTNGRILRVHRLTGASQGLVQWNFDVQTLAIAHTDPGDLAGFGAICPCGNTDSLGGCRNSTAVGAYLGGSGGASITADDLTLSVFNLPPSSFGRIFMGAPANDVAFGDGILCTSGAGGGLIRFPIQLSDAHGRISIGPGLRAFAAENFGAGAQITSGHTWSFQAYYRDATGPCGTGFNTTNASRVTFTP